MLSLRISNNHATHRPKKLCQTYTDGRRLRTSRKKLAMKINLGFEVVYGKPTPMVLMLNVHHAAPPIW